MIKLEGEAASALKAGTNLLAVHCTQTGGGQYIDVHVIDADHIPVLSEPQRSTTPYQTSLLTKWGAEVRPDNAWQEYPRPALQRSEWKNLNGHWDYEVTPRDVMVAPKQWSKKVLVPFAIESKLSGVERLLDPTECLWYHRELDLAPQKGRRLLLNFEAVDYQSEIFLNGESVGKHIGGNLPFTVDITSAAQPGKNELVVRVLDETEGFQLHGKQSLSPRGIWYTQVSGIWQTVWLEEVTERYVEDLKITTDAQRGSITIQPKLSGKPSPGERIVVKAIDGQNTYDAKATGDGRFEVVIPQAKLWSPKQPQLYDLVVQVVDNNQRVTDEVKSYAGIRSVGKRADDQGHLRFTLNDQFIFHWGPLDQGWWPDGLLTPPSDAGMRSDIEYLKAAGFNMIRKHIKVEPRRYYYHCDKLGMMVWQDQVSGGVNPPWTRLQPNPKDAQWPAAAHEQFMAEFEGMVSLLENQPCIVVWTPFNEAWGQHLTMEVGQWAVKRDPTRIINIASGGNFWPVGDVVDEHHYPHPTFPFDPERYRSFVKVVGEFGGHGLPVEGHLWDLDRENWGYGGLPKNAAEYRDRYLESIRLLTELKSKGIAAGVYTQTTDVEGEINGLLTYDRKVQKLSAEELQKIHAPLVGSTP